MKLTLIGTILAIISSSMQMPAHEDDNQHVSFGLEASAPDTKVDGYHIFKVDSHPHVFSVGGNEGYTVLLRIRKDRSIVDGSDRGIYINPDTGEFGNVDPWGEQDPTKGFAKRNGYLVYKDSDQWYACPSGPEKYSLANKKCIGGTSIKLKVHDVKLF